MATDVLPKGCSICDREPIVARGWCHRHYRRWQRYGDPEAGGRIRSDFTPGTLEHLLDCSEERPGPLDTPCRIWTMSIIDGGYGVHGVHGGKPGEITYAHQTAWRLAYGPIPAGVYVCHRCDVRPCVNVEHLFLGNALINNHDAIEKGRARKVRTNRRVTKEQIREFRTLRANGITCREIAESSGFSVKHISVITTERKSDP